MSRRDANQYNILNTVNTGVADRLNPQSLQDSSNELQKQLFDKLELSNFLEPFTLKVATDSIKGSKNGLGAVWAHMYDAVKNKNIMANSDIFRSLSRNLPSGVAEGALRDLQSGGPRAALSGAVRRTVEAAQRGEIPAVNNPLDLIPDEAQEAIRAGRSAGASTSETAAAIQRMATSGGDGRASLLEKSASQLQAELAKSNPQAAAALQDSLDNASAAASAAASRASAAIESPLGTATAAADNASQTLVRTSTRTLGGVKRAVKINPDLLPEDDEGSGGLQQSAFEALGGEDGLPSTEAFDELIRAQRRTEGFGADEVGGATDRTAAELENFQATIADRGRPESWASTAFRKIKNVGQFFDRRIGKEFGAVQPLQVREGQLIVNPADSVLGESLGPRPLAPIADDPVVPDLVGMADEGGGSAVFNPSQIIKNLNLLGGRAPSAERALPTELETMIPEKRARFLRPAEAPERIQPLTAAPQAELIQQPDRLSELRTAGSVDRSGALARIEAGVAKRRLKGRSVAIETKPFGDVKRAYRRTRGRSTTVKPLRRTETDFPEAPAPEAPVRTGPIRTAAEAEALFADDDEEDTSIPPVPKPRVHKDDTSGIWDSDDDGLNEPDSTFDLEGFQRNEANRIANAKSALDRDFPENMFDEDEEEEAAPAAAEVVAPNVVRGGGSEQAVAAATTTDEGSGGADSAVASTLSQLRRGGPTRPTADEAVSSAATTTTDEAVSSAAATTTDEAVSSAAATTTDEVASSGAASLDQVIQGAATGFLTEQAAGGLEGIDAIPVLGDVAGVLAGLGGALAIEFLNKPEASPVEHIRNVVNVASEFGSSQ